MSELASCCYPCNLLIKQKKILPVLQVSVKGDLKGTESLENNPVKTILLDFYPDVLVILKLKYRCIAIHVTRACQISSRWLFKSALISQQVALSIIFFFFFFYLVQSVYFVFLFS